MGRVVARNISIVPGANKGLYAELMWFPFDSSGKKGVEAGREMISRYVSGKIFDIVLSGSKVGFHSDLFPIALGLNTTITIRSDWKTIPTLPELGRALSRLHLEIPVPKLPPPPGQPDGIDDDDRPHFIQDTTVRFHLYSPTAAPQRVLIYLSGIIHISLHSLTDKSDILATPMEINSRIHFILSSTPYHNISYID